MRTRASLNQNLFYRSFEIERAAVDEDGRTVDVSFSSETPVKRWFGDEYLMHGKGNVDLARLKSMGAALLNHDPSRIVGAVQNPRIEDNRGLATVVFDDDDDGNRAFGKVKSGSLKGLSVGYQVSKFRDVTEGEEFDPGDGRKIKGPAMVALRWQPYEISFTPIPADSSVGVGRCAVRSLDGIEIEHKPKHTEESTMERHEIVDLIRSELEKLELPTAEEIAEKIQNGQRISYQVEPDVAQELLGRAQAVSQECRSKVADMIVTGKSELEILREIGNMQAAPDGQDNSRDQDPANNDKTGLVERMSDEAFDRMILEHR